MAELPPVPINSPVLEVRSATQTSPFQAKLHRELVRFLNELRRRFLVPVLLPCKHRRHAERRRRERAGMVSKILESGELTIECGAVLLKNIVEHVRLKFIEYHVDNIFYGRKLIDGSGRLSPARALRGVRLATARSDRGRLYAQEYQRRERRDPADRPKKNQRNEKRGSPANELVRSAPRICGEVELLPREHTVVRIPKIALAPQQEPDCE